MFSEFQRFQGFRETEQQQQQKNATCVEHLAFWKEDVTTQQRDTDVSK